MFEIDWHQLNKNNESNEIGFESFTFQIAWQRYSSYGSFEYDYNTPGSEFYLTLGKDNEELKAKAGEVVGWQAKNWVNPQDMLNTSFDSNRRKELVEALRKSLSYKPNLVTWIISTPGQPINTEPHKTKNKLIKSLMEVKPALNIEFWTQ